MHLSNMLSQMKALKELYLEDSQLGDKGTRYVIEKLDENNIALEVLDLSGNLIGQSSYFKDTAEAFCNFFPKQAQMESLQLNNNMLRGVLGYQIAKCISESMTI